MFELLWLKTLDGGPLMAAIAAVSVVAWALILERFLYLRGRVRADRQAARLLAQGRGEALPRRSAAAGLGPVRRLSAEAFGAHAEEIAQRRRHRASRGLALIGRLGATAPLLGLLGTVTGMIVTFEAITLHGASHPRAMADGISQALLTTQAGLLTAIPVLLAQRYLGRLARRAEEGAALCLDRARALWTDGGEVGRD